MRWRAGVLTFTSSDAQRTNMKMTLVIDTDDPSGINDAFKMVSIMRQRHSHHHVSHVSPLTISKIPLIKALRMFVKEQVKNHVTDDNAKISKAASLRDAKVFAEKMFDDDAKPF
jgi:hypothetical protein